MARCLDTSFLIDLSRGLVEAREKARLFETESEPLFVPSPALAEFLDGAHFVGGSYLTRALQMVARRNVLALDDTTSRRTGQLRAELRRRGSPLPLVDVMIAAITLEHHHVLVTRDAGFARVPGLATESY